MLSAMEYLQAELVAICEYEADQADVVWIDSGNPNDADGLCSGDGLISPSSVFDVVQLP